MIISLLKLILLVILLYNLIKYFSARQSHQKARKQLLQDRPVRKLASIEKQILNSLSDIRNLSGDDVYYLTGSSEILTLNTNYNNSVTHYTIGGIEVVLPYDAALYLDANNEAEAALTSDNKLAVVSLNGKFFIEEAWKLARQGAAQRS
ncbi:hypothetical protein GCM10009122_04970 [Fulvivirga kasyanovii]|uniref:DUF4230 domain-containing protein n=1 Tax=Fulvivirga kasyanovii TaxID=396812 RepID=A0ABW9RNJ0_9BACT|nr:hypothetical protein [Fulvivirga kasyanovii]MTI25588.1 hypothetical protein [Fulvivirga kasyanovii]